MGIKLTLRTVETAKARAKPYELRDTDIKGLLLRVQPSGAKSFIVEWSRGKRSTLGRFPVLTLVAARTRALAVLSDAAQHGTPNAARPKRKDGVATFRDFLEEMYRPWASTKHKNGNSAPDRLLSAFEDFADKPLTRIDLLAVEQWRTKRIRAGVTKSTCNRELATLKAALKLAGVWGLEVASLAKLKLDKIDNSRARFLTVDEEKRLRLALEVRDAKGRAARERGNQWRQERGKDLMPVVAPGEYSDHLTPAVLLSLNTGLRKGELIALYWSDINVSESLLTVRAAAAKSNKSRHVPLNPEARRVLERWREQQPDGRIFPVKDFKTAWNGLMASSGITLFRWHDLRHTFASKLVMAGVDLNTVRELLGHTDLKMTLRYAHLAHEHKAAAVALISGDAT
jgi:integrase